MSFTVGGKILKYDTTHTNLIHIKSRSKNYTVNFGKGISKIQTNDVLVIDKNVAKMYDVASYFNKVIMVDAIEDNKNMDSVLQIIDQLSNYSTKKSDIMHVYGGGITQDVSGMAASMYKRGLIWNYTPTTLLSMCDSCIGSKVNVNFKKTKNQIGTMYPPNEVTIDTTYLQTLSKSDLDSGVGEILKLFSIANIPWDIRNLDDSIKTCLNIKKSIIEEDEYENTIRPILNYGHTFGHVFETLSDFKIPHGIAVLLGMYVVDCYFGQDISRYSIFSEKMKRYSKHIKYDEELFFTILQNDKKMKGDILNLIKVEHGFSHMVGTLADLNMVKRVYFYIDNL